MKQFTNRIINCDCIEGMKMLPDNCVSMCVTSPPYWGLRSYLPDGVVLKSDDPDWVIKAGYPENGLVLDCFGGAGTTGLVARKLNRNYLLYELNSDYCKIAEKRIHNEIGIFN